jgi:cholesterol oxidase
MGRDVPDGKLFINGRYLNSDWNTKGSSEYFDRIRSSMKDIADELNGRFFDNPIWGLSRVITVHPLGGCPMARNEKEGVVDSYGRVFGYPGFYIADGSVMPGPVGPNPSLTIAALADRFADKVIAESRVGDG